MTIDHAYREDIARLEREDRDERVALHRFGQYIDAHDAQLHEGTDAYWGVCAACRSESFMAAQNAIDTGCWMGQR